MGLEADDRVDALIIGAGIAGLCAARRLHEQGYTVLVLEKDTVLGGRVRTELVDGRNVDVGAQFISDFYHSTLELIRGIDAEGILVRRSQRAFIARNQTKQPIWPLKDLLRGHGLSLWTKVRLLCLLPSLARHWRVLDIADLGKSASLDTTAAAAFLRRRLGSEALHYFFAPVLRGLLYWDAATTSTPVVLSILKAFATNGKTYRVEHGGQQLIAALADGITIHRDVEVTDVRRAPNGELAIDAAAGDGQRRYRARAVVFAAPATVACRLAPSLPPELSGFLESITYSRTAILTFRVEAAKDYPQGAVLFPSHLVSDLSSANPLYDFVDDSRSSDSAFRLLNVYLSSPGYAQYRDLPDDELCAVVLRRLNEVMGPLEWTKNAKVVNVHRWPEALPELRIGYLKELAKFERRQEELDGLVFAGDYLGGPYIDGAVRSGLRAGTIAGRYLQRSGKT